MKLSSRVPASGRRAPTAIVLACSSAVATLTLLGCGDEEHPPLLPAQPPPDAAKPCEQAEPVNPFFRTELLADVEYWDCPLPLAGEGNMSFTESRGTSAVVTGSEARFSLAWEGDATLDGHEVIVWMTPGAKGFYAFPAPSDTNPQEITLLMNTEVKSGDYQVAFGISDGRDERGKPVLGRIFRSPLHVIQVGSGDIQVNLNWQSVLDLDLRITEPGGTEVNKGVIYWSNKQSPSGGTLDLDSYANCTNVDADRGRGNENIFWPIGAAPHGKYKVEVTLFKERDATDSTNQCDAIDAEHPGDYRVTVVSGDSVTSYPGEFVPRDTSRSRVVTTFDY